MEKYLQKLLKFEGYGNEELKLIKQFYENDSFSCKFKEGSPDGTLIEKHPVLEVKLNNKVNSLEGLLDHLCLKEIDFAKKMKEKGERREGDWIIYYGGYSLKNHFRKDEGYFDLNFPNSFMEVHFF